MIVYKTLDEEDSKRPWFHSTYRTRTFIAKPAIDLCTLYLTTSRVLINDEKENASSRPVCGVWHLNCRDLHVSRKLLEGYEDIWPKDSICPSIHQFQFSTQRPTTNKKNFSVKLELFFPIVYPGNDLDLLIALRIRGRSAISVKQNLFLDVLHAADFEKETPSNIPSRLTPGSMSWAQDRTAPVYIRHGD
jgi:hypothetical protein